MKKTLFSLILIFCIFNQINASNYWVDITSKSPKKAEIKLISSDIQSSIISVKIEGFYKNSVTINNKNVFSISLNGATPILEKGNPDLPKLTSSIIIPDLAEMEVTVVSSSYKDFNNIEIAPSKGNLFRNINPNDVPYNYGEIYTKDKFFPSKNADLREPYILRDFRAQTVIIYPFQYNPVTKILRVYNDLTIKISKKSENGLNQYKRIKNIDKIDYNYNNIYSNQFLNYNKTKYEPLTDQGKMLIICYGQFMNSMQPFVNWKRSLGIPTEIINVTTAGTTANAIKTYVANYYNTNGLTFLLLVGDAAQIPTNTGTGLGGPSDNAYGFILGNDHYQEIFVGRFSAENISQVETQAQRMIKYEKNPIVTGDWLKKGVCIASSQGGNGQGDDGEIDYEHQRNIRTDLMNYNYTAVDELYDDYFAGGVDLQGNPTATMLKNDINNGLGIISYTGHGSDNSFVTTNFSSTDIGTLNNINKLPFIWSVACVNGNFVGQTCFAETWLRGSKSNEPVGAIGTMMSTINQSWDPPMEGQDEMVDILVESYTNNIKHTFAGISVNGLFKMNDTYGTAGNDMTDTWTLFGDPSLVVRSNTPQQLTATHNSIILLGSSQFTVNCPVEGAKVCLSLNGQILGTSTVSSGSAIIDFNAVSTLDTIDLVISAYNYIPYIQNVPIIPPTGPYVIYNALTVNDNLGNNNSLVDFGETIKLNITLKNVGISQADSVYAVLSTEDSFITINDSTHSWGNIINGQTSLQNDAFVFNVNNNIPDRHNINFKLKVYGTNDFWESSFNVSVNAPNLEIGNLTILDNVSGNNNGRLDPGETVDIKILNKNTGHCPASNTLCTFSSSNSFITVNNSAITIDTLSGNEYTIFNITVNNTASIGSIADFNYIITSGLYTVETTFSRPIGLIEETFETGNFTHMDWIHSGNQTWKISNTGAYQGTYCAQSKTITDNQTSTLSVTFRVLSEDSIIFYRKVSSEATYDFLNFYIDNDKKDSWSGNVSWGRVAYHVSEGIHTFMWEYSKDNMVSAGSDCAWIDNIIFPPVMSPNAPLNVTTSATPSNICLGNSSNLKANVVGGSGNYNYLWSPNTGLSANNIFNPIASPSVTTTYTVIVTDSLNSDTATIVINVNQLPSAPTISFNNYTLSSDVQTGNQWYLNNTPIHGATSNTFTPILTGNYSDKVTNSSGCVSEMSNAIYVDFTAINDISKTKEFLLLPNPAKDFVCVNLNSTYKMCIFNSLGIKIYDKKDLWGNNKITLNNFSKGIYFVFIYTKDKIFKEKLIIE